MYFWAGDWRSAKMASVLLGAQMQAFSLPG